MNRSLKIALQLCSDGKTLADRVQHALDILTDITDQFEITLVDQGSTDHALEMAHELAREYPQIRVAEGEASESVFDDLASDALVYVQNDSREFDANHIRKLGRMVHPRERKGLDEASTPTSTASGIASPHNAAGRPASRLRMAELRRRRDRSARSTQLRIDLPPFASDVPLPFSAKARETRGSTGSARSLAPAPSNKRRWLPPSP